MSFSSKSFNKEQKKESQLATLSDDARTLATVLLENELKGQPTEFSSGQLTPELITAVRVLAEQANGLRAEVARRTASTLEKALSRMKQNEAQRNALWETLQTFINAETWAKSHRIVEQHPELLSDETEALLEQIINMQTDERVAHLLTEYHNLLLRCRTEGMEGAFAYLMQSDQSASDRKPMWEIPDEFETEVQELTRLIRMTRNDPRLYNRLKALIEHMLQRIQHDQHPIFRARLLSELGRTYANLPAGDRVSNLHQAIACYREVLTIYTPKTSPLDYAANLHDLGATYSVLPTGVRTENLQQAIICYQEALRYIIPDKAPHLYAVIQTNLGSAYWDLHTDIQDVKVQQAVACFQEALRFHTPEVAAIEYASIQVKLGNIYEELSMGGQFTNLKQAIECYQEALRFYTPEVSFREYALIQTKLGIALARLPTDNRATNLKQAIECFQEALRFYTPEVAPLQYGIFQTALGKIYCQLPTSHRATNLQQAIECFQEALRFYTPEVDPLQYADIQISLGRVYSELPTGDQVANFENAFACYREVLRFCTLEIYPDLHADTQIEMGKAYIDLPIGDHFANLQKALECFQEALHHYTSETHPHKHAQILMELGIIYNYLPSGDQIATLWTGGRKFHGPYANQFQAVEYFQDALDLITPEIDPISFATIQMNLGNAYIDLPIEDYWTVPRAITCYEEALRFLTPENNPQVYVGTQINLGNAYIKLSSGVHDENLRRAIACFQEALRIFTPESNPLGYAVIQTSLGSVYAKLPKDDREENPQQAITHYHEALRFFTSKIAPARNRDTAADLANLYFNGSRWEEAHTAYTMAIESGEILYRVAATDVARQTELGRSANLFPKDAYCLARMGHLSETVERLEKGRARFLDESLGLDRASLEQVNPEDRKAFESARVQLKILQAETRSVQAEVRGTIAAKHHQMQGTARSFTELSSDLIATYQEMDAVVNRIRSYIPDFMSSKLGYDAISAMSSSAQPLVYIVTTEQGSLALIVPARGNPIGARHVVWCDDFTSDNLNDLLGVNMNWKYLAGLTEGKISQLQAELEKVLPIIGEQLMKPLDARLAALGFQRVILIPYGLLSILPLHAAQYTIAGNSNTFIDRFDVAYTPSARTLTHSYHVGQAASICTRSILAIGDPFHKGVNFLPFARVEVEDIISLFPVDASHSLYGEQATRPAILKIAPDYTYLHFSCHGYLDSWEPLHSALLLAGEDRLTLQDILNEINFSGVRLTVLSACQTSVIGFRAVPDETLGLPAGLMIAGVPCVIGSLWSVSDLSTVFLMARFYRNHINGEMNFSRALREAQLWVRELKADEAAKWAEQFYRQTEGDGKVELLKLVKHYHYLAKQDPTSQPFAHPYYWAGFTLYGI